MASNADKDALIAELADARTRMRGNFRALRYDLEILPRVKANITRNPLAWFSAATILGLLFSRAISPRAPQVTVKVPSHSRDVTEKAGKAAFLVTALKFALDFAKPALLRYLNERLHTAGSAPRR